MTRLGWLALLWLCGCRQVLDLPERESKPNLDCDGGQCQCTSTWRDCNEDLAADGCEVDVDVDAMHCGACGHDCLGGACTAGRCQPFAISDPLTTQALVMVIDESDAYVGTSEGVLKVPLVSGATGELIAPLMRGPRAVALHDGEPIWLSGQGIENAEGAVVPATMMGHPVAMHVRGDTLTYAIGMEGMGFRVERLDLVAPSAPTVLATTALRPTAIVANDEHVFWFGEPVDKGLRLMGDRDPDAVLDEWLTTAMNPTALGLHIDGDTLFYTHATLGGFQLSRLDVGTGETDIDPRLNVLQSFAVADGTIFHSDNNGVVGSLPRDEAEGLESTTWATGQDGATLVQANDELVVWLSSAPVAGDFEVRVFAVAR